MTDNSVFERMMAVAFDPEIVRCIKAIQALTDYDISPEQAAPFLRFHEFLSEPTPKYITDWREDAHLEKWYHAHVNGVLGDVRGAIAAAQYHAERLFEIEASVAAFLETTTFKKRLGQSTMSPGATRKMDFEYQAFVLAYRRALDYLAGSLACYFKTEASSFRTLPKTIRNTKCPPVAQAISDAQARHVGKLGFVLAEGRRSVRNRIAHYDFVSAGCINLSPQGFFIAGGGEDLRMGPDFRSATLMQVITQKLGLLHDCTRDLIDSFIQAAREQDGKRE